MTAGFVFHVTCPDCGSPAEHVATGTSNGTETQAITRCTRCGVRLLLTLTLGTIGIPGHGTNSGYHAHRRRSERPCEACVRAHADYERNRWKRAGRREEAPA